MQPRQGENERVRFRSERIFAVNDQWYFLTRDLDQPLGPYISRQQTQQYLDAFMRDLQANVPVAQAVTNLRRLSDAYTEDDY